MKRTTQLTSALVLGLVMVNVVAADTWTWKTDMPTARRSCAASEVAGKIYVIGGWKAFQDPNPLATVEMYDPATDTWERKADVPTPRAGLATVVLDGKIYAIGGSRGTSPFPTVEVYDPVTDTWEQGVNMSTARWFHSAVVLEGSIYVIGGVHSWTMEEYNPDSGIWTSKAGMPTDRWVAGTAVLNGRIYVTGGNAGPVAEYDETASVLEYDPITDSWTQKADMPIPRVAHSVVVMHSRMYCVAGGVGTVGGPGDPGPPTAVWMYNPATDTWEIRSDTLTQQRSDAAVAAANGKIYVFGGFSDRTCATVAEYTPSPIVDFNGDYAIDIEDLLLLIEHWGGSDPAFDVAPPPFGDGIIDAQDLEVLMSDWGQELGNPTWLAHWKLDETEGLIAHDSAAGLDATVVGAASWRPDSGKIDGAIELDGATFLTTGFVLDPVEGPFSIFAWVKGGAPGQVIVSQTNGANWLMADPARGLLMTELKGAGRLSRALCSQTMITDGAWHRLGLVWDGSNRILYVNDVEVARDAQSSLAGTYAGLHIGAGKALEPGSFFSGLIDDVRIYNRAVKP